MIFTTINSVFSYHLKDLHIDKKFVSKFQEYLMSVIAKDEDHIAFLSSTYIGLHKVTYTASDKNNFWNIILDADRDDVAEDLHSIPNPNYRVRGAKESEYRFLVLKEWKVGGDVTNHALMYLIHLALNSKEINDKEREFFCRSVLTLLQYKFLTGFLRNDFEFAPRRDVVLAAYSELNRKFLIKQVNSWKEYFNLRATTIYEGEGNRKDMMGYIKRYNDHREIINSITGISNNLRDMMNAYNQVFYRVHGSDSRLSLSSPIVTNSEGDSSLRESLNHPGRYLTYIGTKVGIETEFVDEELLSILVTGTSVRYTPTITVLKYINDNYGQRRQEDIEEFIRLSITFSLHTLEAKRTGLDNIGDVFQTVMGSISARRSADSDLEDLRKHGKDIAKRALPNNSDTSTIMNVIACYLLIFAIRNKK